MDENEEKTLPCGHSRRQAGWLGCTETACRPGDAKLVQEYTAWKRSVTPAR